MPTTLQGEALIEAAAVEWFRTRIHKPNLQLPDHRLRQAFEELRLRFLRVRLAKESATDFDDVVLAKGATGGVDAAADFGGVGGFPGRDLLPQKA